MSAGSERLANLAETNRRTLDAIRAGNAEWPRDAFYGFFQVDIFNCPPFAMFTANDCPRSFNIIYQGTFEPASMALWCRYAREASAILDIGAHVGVYSLAAAALRRDIPIHAFEPNPFAAARLRLNKNFNGFDNIVERRMGLAHKTTMGTISWVREKRFIPSGAIIARHLRDDGAFEEAYVQLATLDSLDIGDIGGRGLIKIDAEGAESFIFKGMGRRLEARPDIILEVFSPDNCDEINASILPLGYKVYLIHEDTGVLELQDKLIPRTRESADFNQFLTTRDIVA